MRYPTQESAERNLAALTVTCPYCAAPPDADCSRHGVALWPPHRSRMRLGLAVRACPHCAPDELCAEHVNA